MFLWGGGSPYVDLVCVYLGLSVFLRIPSVGLYLGSGGCCGRGLPACLLALLASSSCSGAFLQTQDSVHCALKHTLPLCIPDTPTLLTFLPSPGELCPVRLYMKTHTPFWTS